MAREPQALHDHVASRMEKAMGRALPQMEVRFKDVSISANIVVKDETNAKTELPTLINVLKSSYNEMRSSKHVIKKQVLKDINGVFKPGTITLVLGQPGSGKSSSVDDSRTRRTLLWRARSRTMVCRRIR
ncbi:hypothetical protein PI125_g22778 [Phytophthora idaei]|nr:hypothetical protein PI125_g22778 [Phytophthora idaei]KAG3136668.1 hypothetical protein PI126_g17720 [Phytophthora idaei]